MKGKDFKIIYEKLYENYINQFISEVEKLYKEINLEGGSEIYAYNTCCTFLSNKNEKLNLHNNELSAVYSIYHKRSSYVRDNNLNLLYSKHIIPLCQSLNIEMSEALFETLLNKYAISDASNIVNSWYTNWSTIYGMMFELNDFSEFKIIRNSSFSENSEIFKKYQKKLNPNRIVLDEKKDFKLRDEYKDCIEKLYSPMTEKYISENLSSFEDFTNVFFKNWKSHNSKVYFSCTPEEASYFLFKLKFAFEKLSFASISRSELFLTKEGNLFKEDNLSKHKNKIIPEEAEEIHFLLNEVGLLNTD